MSSEFIKFAFEILQEVSIFLLAFTIIYMVLNQTKSISDKKNINLIIALSISLTFMIASYFVESALKFIQLTAIIFVLGFLVIILAGLFNFDFQTNRYWYLFSGAFIFIVILFLAFDINIIDYILNNFSGYLIFAVLLFIIAKIITNFGENEDFNKNQKTSNKLKSEKKDKNSENDNMKSSDKEKNFIERYEPKEDEIKEYK